MGGRIFDHELKCGCLLSTDKGGGLLPCYAEWGDMKKKKDKECLELHNKCWEEYSKSDIKKEHDKLIREKNA